jgi:acyl carrier protein
MNETSIQNSVFDVFADVFGVAESDLAVTSTRDDFEDWDSLGHIRLVTALEARFGVSLTVQQIESLQSVGDVVDCIGTLAS